MYVNSLFLILFLLKKFSEKQKVIA